LGAFPARSAGNRAFRSNLFVRPGGQKVFPLQSLARLQTGAFSRRIRRYLFFNVKLPHNLAIILLYTIFYNMMTNAVLECQILKPL
jgi:hypothetical protein